MRWSEEGGACLTSVKASALLELRDFYDIWRGRGNNVDQRGFDLISFGDPKRRSPCTVCEVAVLG